MTHDTPPKRIWVIPDTSGVGHEWHSGWYQGRQNVRYSVEYTLTSEAEAMVAAALRGAADAVSERADWPEDDHGRTLHPELFARVVEAILNTTPQPASAALDKLIAEAVNEAMLQCIGIVANLRNKRNPGPLFEVLNRAMSDIEDARFAAIREKNNG